MSSFTELSTLLAVVFGAFGTILVGFYRYAQTRERDFEKSRQIMAEAYERSNEKLAVSLERVAKATERSADEAKTRNGHLAEIQLENQKLIIEHSKLSKQMIHGSVDKVLKAVQNVKEQHVEHQTVDETNLKGK